MKLHCRKKFTEIEAIQWKGNNESEVKIFCPVAIFGNTFLTPSIKYNTAVIIPGLIRNYFANLGDFIIKDKDGYFSSCKEDAFYELYEEVKQDGEV